ncbi:MoaD/ThiS family protein [Streptomyces sp. NBC_01803]|uniref:MoaD/ThiS family protein n=1 Tax=Streptomyces sp. NBC_01803 TaxID=2975946 RepID=UPI002DDB40E4|nr:MoaD/ThiS family protein [Streptomyces sp. NBC_01803]WSA42960.1 MoaD/ThiS family protein [Streptomyces sp. NBC_01803]
MATMLLFSIAREAAGLATFECAGSTIEEVLEAARRDLGSRFRQVSATCQVWLDGEIVRDLSLPLEEDSEIALIPPVAGG